ncbi:MAG: helix-turn-helix domain-containing protein [Acidobacteria bacterium]|nr:helix-turn-helix domain-containing protein [Acidobacteriota bacterium]
MSEKNAFLKTLGQRIRALRLATGWSIDRLARQSELSPRFLSEIEAGRGNVSVARLSQIAHALEQPIQNLIPAAKDDISLRGRIWELLQDCQTKDLDELYTWLAARQRKHVQRSIALVGVRGAGKSTIGKLLAARLDVGFVEFDALIEKEAGISLNEMFRIHGDEYYRKLERRVMEKYLATSPRSVLATGGSLVTAPETWAMVRRECHTVWLKATARDHWDRVVAQGDMRPVGKPGAMDDLRALLKLREPLYARSEIVVDTSHHSVEESVALIIKRVRAVESNRRTDAVNDQGTKPKKRPSSAPAGKRH